MELTNTAMVYLIFGKVFPMRALFTKGVGNIQYGLIGKYDTFLHIVKVFVQYGLCDVVNVGDN